MVNPETTDASIKEQLVICIRWVDQALEIHEDFIGLHQLDTTDVSVRMNLSLRKCRGQCYSLLWSCSKSCMWGQHKKVQNLEGRP